MQEDEIVNETLESENIAVKTDATVIEVPAAEVVDIEMSEAFPASSEGDALNHALLNNREIHDQHPIFAITGLREELDEIERLKTVYSDKIGVANFYKWHNGAYDEFGYFVSLAPHTSEITICDGADIFGVAVDGTMVGGFIGGQDEDVPRDNTYALVATSGLVDVRCESTVAEGDYVVSNADGIATTTDSGCGYKVIAIEDKHGVTYAVIALGVQACTTDVMGQQIQHLDERMDDAETNIAAAMNVANEAYNKSIESDSVSEEAVLKALEALAQANGAVDATDEMNKILESVNSTAAKAKAIAESAALSAESMRKEAVEAANGALDKAGEIEKTVEPITTWKYEDPVTGVTNEGATYFVEYMENGLATKAEMETVTRLDEENKLLITKNAENFQQMLSSVDKYSIGEYSQAYGLTLQQARNILTDGMIYIPTKRGEENTHIEKYADGENVLEREFTYGYYYAWSLLSDGEYMWSERLGEVWFNKEQPTGSAYTYWYDGSHLHILTDGEWIEIATLAGNVNNRITSMIRQDVDSVTAEIVNAYGSVAGFGAQLSDTTAKANMAATWVLENDPSAGDSTISNVAAVDISADQDGSQMALVVSQKDGNRTVKGASIVMDQNGTDSYIAISADNIVMDGTAKFITPGDLSGEKTTEINGANITTGKIDAERIKVEDLQALGATIAGWQITEDQLFYEDKSANIEIGLSPGQGGTYNTDQNLGLVLYAGTKAPSEPKAIAGTWRFTEKSDDIKDFLRDAYLSGSVEFAFYGWFNHPTSGWTKYEGQSARLTFVYSGDEAFEITLSVDNSSAQMLWGCGSYNAVPWTSDVISERLLNREIGFGVEGIDDVWIGDYQFGTNILSSIATFIPGSIGMYPAMLDKDGRLYAQEVRLGGSADSVVEVGRCAVGNIIINNDAMVYKKGWSQAGGFYLGKDGLTVGENFRVQSKGVAAGSVIVGNAADAHTDGTVACKVLDATDVTATKVTATDVTVTDATATNIKGDNCTLRQIDLNDTNGDGAAIFHSNASYVHCNAKFMLSVQENGSTSGRWQGMMIDFGANTLKDSSSTALRIGPVDGGFQVSSDGTMNATNPEFSGALYANGEQFLSIPSTINEGETYYVEFQGLWKDAGGKEVATSDARLKHDIESLDERYDVFFDNLEAQRFKYNVGTSDRYHTGYTTQGVQKALATAEIPEKEFAGVVTLNQGTENEESALRYYEFVSLNTDQIQKLKKRVDALEAKNAELEVKNAKLEERLAKLEALLNNNAK